LSFVEGKCAICLFLRQDTNIVNPIETCLKSGNLTGITNRTANRWIKGNFIAITRSGIIR
jgi:hypothetical protein